MPACYAPYARPASELDGGIGAPPTKSGWRIRSTRSSTSDGLNVTSIVAAGSSFRSLLEPLIDSWDSRSCMDQNDASFLEKLAESDGLEKDREEALRERYSEYHHYAALRLSQSIDKNGSLPTNISAVKLLGSPNTRIGFLKRAVKPLLSPDSTRGLKETLDELAITADKLVRFGIYDSVTVELDESNSTGGHNDLEATIHLRERSRLWARTGTDFGNQEGSAYASANMRNVFGGAETLEGSMSFGTRTKTSHEVRFSTPVLADPNTLFEVQGYGSSRSNPYASHDENARGASAKLKHIGRYAVHDIGILAVNRQITNLHSGASLYIRHCAGITRKLSILHTMTRDTRDDPILPTSGYRLRTAQELAGGKTLGGDASFFKLEVDGSRHVSLTNDLKTTLNLSAKCGFLWPLGANMPTLLNDRFQLGGPQSVRGFMHNGLGPRSGRDSLGGNMFLSMGTSILTPVPHAPEHWPLRLQAFINSGSLVAAGDSNGTSAMHKLLFEPSVTAGFGLVFKHPAARVEMSFCLPIVARSTDRVRKGLQFGLGVDFL